MTYIDKSVFMKSGQHWLEVTSVDNTYQVTCFEIQKNLSMKVTNIDKQWPILTTITIEEWWPILIDSDQRWWTLTKLLVLKFKRTFHWKWPTLMNNGLYWQQPAFKNGDQYWLKVTSVDNTYQVTCFEILKMMVLITS